MNPLQSLHRVLDSRSLLGALVLLPTLMILPACDRSAAKQAETAVAAAPEVLTVAAKPAGESLELRLPARAVAGESARIYARATGFLAERRVDLGDHVEAGQVLAIIVAPEIEQAVREAEAGLGQAKADEELAKVNFDRAAALIGSGAISKEVYNERNASNAVARAARSAAEARLAGAREHQGFKTVRAPFAGVIAARNVERGDRVVGDQSGASSLFDLAALDPLRILVDVPQSAALQVRAGVKAEVSFAELPGEKLLAEVVRSAQSISEGAGGMRVELRLPNPQERIPAGMIGEVKLSLPRSAQAALVPVSAVVRGARGAQVAMVGDDSTLNYRTVVTGRNLGSEIEIVNGLAPGEIVIASPNALLLPGTKVVVKKVAGAT